MTLLTIYSDIVGILGGLLVGTTVMGFSACILRADSSCIDKYVGGVFSGVTKSLLFGLIIGLVGCYKGIYSGRDSAALVNP